jgi:hypothetical protein
MKNSKQFTSNFSLNEDTEQQFLNQEFRDTTESVSLDEDTYEKNNNKSKKYIEITFTAIAATILIPFLFFSYPIVATLKYITNFKTKKLETKLRIEKAKERTLFLKKVNQNNNSLLTNEEKKLKQRMLNKLAKKPKVPYVNRDGSFNYNEYLMQGKNAKIDWSKFMDDCGYLQRGSYLSNEAIYKLVKSNKFLKERIVKNKNLANLIINENFSYIYSVRSDVFEDDYFFTKKILERALKTGHSHIFIRYFKENYSMAKPLFIDLMIKALEVDNNIIHIEDIYYKTINNLLQNEDFVRKYVNSYIEILNNYGEKYYDDIDHYGEINFQFEEAYKEFEEKRLLALLPAKQDEAPTKQRKKI